MRSLPFVASSCVVLLLSACPRGGEGDDGGPNVDAGVVEDGGVLDDAGALVDGGGGCGADVCTGNEACVDVQDPDTCGSEPTCVAVQEGARCFDNDDPCTHVVACPAPLVCRTTCMGPCDGYLGGVCAPPAGAGEECENLDEERHPCADGLACDGVGDAGAMLCE